MATPPTFVAEYESAWNTTATKTVAVTAAVGDLLVLAAGAEGTTTFGTPTTPTGLAWTQRSNMSLAAYLRSWTSPVTTAITASNITVSSSAGLRHGFNCLRFSDHGGVGAVAAPATDQNGAPSQVITTTADNSAIVVFVTDWNAVAAGSRAWRAVNGFTPTAGNGGEKTFYQTAGTDYTVYCAVYPDAGAAGAKTVGLTAPTGQNYNIVAIEVKGTAGSSSFTATVANTLPSITSAATASSTPPAFSGAVAATLPSLTQSATANASPPGFTGGIAQTLPSLTSAATATSTPPAYTGTVAATLPSITSAATATRTVPAFTLTGANTLPSLTQAATAQALVPGSTATIAQTLPSLTSAATAVRTVPAFTAAVAQTLPSLLSAAIAAFTAAGASGPTLTVWNGTTEVPATLAGVWNGITTVPATIEGIV